jgi:hypothetical protein
MGIAFPWGSGGWPPGDRLPMMHPVKEGEAEIEQQTNFYVDPFIGWRSWNVVVVSEKVLLRSVTYKTLWTPGTEFTARCKKNVVHHYQGQNVPENHSSPSKEHGCGIYAVTNQADAAKWCAFSTESTFRVMGEVKLWGAVFRYTRGYLSQYAYPKSILVPFEIPNDYPIEDPREIVHELRKSYRGVEVKLL